MKEEKLVFNLHFIDYCNFKCKHCFVNKESYELSLDNIKFIGDKLINYSRKYDKKVRVNIAGGEPLCSKNLQSVIDYYTNLGLEVSIVTNGYLLSEKFIIDNCTKLSMIGISVDSLSDNNNRIIGRCDKDGKTLTTKRLIEISLLVKKFNIKLKINHCVSRLNLNSDISYLLDTLKPDRVKIFRCLGDSDFKYLISDEEWKNIKIKYGRYTDIIFEDNDYMKEHYIIIDSKGNLSRDNLHMTNNSLLIGDVETCLAILGINYD